MRVETCSAVSGPPSNCPPHGLYRSKHLIIIRTKTLFPLFNSTNILSYEAISIFNSPPPVGGPWNTPCSVLICAVGSPYDRSCNHPHGIVHTVFDFGLGSAGDKDDTGWGSLGPRLLLPPPPPPWDEKLALCQLKNRKTMKSCLFPSARRFMFSRPWPTPPARGHKLALPYSSKKTGKKGLGLGGFCGITVDASAQFGPMCFEGV